MSAKFKIDLKCRNNAQTVSLELELFSKKYQQGDQNDQTQLI